MAGRTKKKPQKLGSNLEVYWTQAFHHLIGRPTLFPFTYLLNPAFSVTILSSCSTLERKNIPIAIQACLAWEHPNALPRMDSPVALSVQRLHSSRDQSPVVLGVSFGSGVSPLSFCVLQVAFRIPFGRLPRRAAGSWPEYQWCLSLHGSAGRLGRVSSSGDPCRGLESKDSNVSQLWSAEQAWQQPKENTGKFQTKNWLS